MQKFVYPDIKKINYSDVFHHIYRHKKVSKQSIANALEMSLPTVTQHLNSLLAQGLIQKSGYLESQIGRKAAAYSVVADYKTAVGVEILQKRVLFMVLDLYGNVLGTKNQMIAFEMSDAYASEISRILLDFLHTLNIAESQVSGAGFALQGLVSQDGSEIVYGKVLNCTGMHIRLFQEQLPFPCRFLHDAECAATSALWHNTEIKDALYLSIGNHLGGALIIDGKISQGRTGRSGTFEHMTLVLDGAQCYCGQKGCMECYCSVQALLHDEEDLDRFFEKKNAQDPDAQKRWQSFLQYLAIAVNNLHMVVDCTIILGGHIAPYLTDEDVRTLHRLVQERTAFPEDEIFLLQSERKKHAVAIGAALPDITGFLQGI